MYIDANVIIYAALDNTKLGDTARELLRRSGPDKIPAAISALVFDEVLWAIQRMSGRQAAAEFGKILLSMPFSWLNAGYASVKHALAFYKQGLDPRDAIHAGIMRNCHVHEIISEDAHFDGLKEIKRTSIADAVNRK